MNRPIRIRRRQFLMGLGGAALAVPLLSSLLPKGEAQTPVIKNFISYRITNGHYGHQWYPSDATTGAGLQVVAPNVREMRLADIVGPISPLLGTDFDRFRDKMSLFRHIDRLDLGDHNKANGLFGWSTKDQADNAFGGLPASIDQLIARRAFATPHVPLNLCVRWSGEGVSCSMSVTSAGTLAKEPGLYPEQAFQRLFGSAGVDETTADRRRGYLRTIVDRVLPHYQSVRTNPRLSSIDRAVLDQHVEHMFTLQTELSRASVACTDPARPMEFGRRPEEVDAAAQAQIDIAVAALRCGLTRVVNLYLDPDTIFDSGLHGVVGGHHGASHNSDSGAVTSVENAHRWHMRYLSDFLGKLDDSVDPEGGGNLLDSSLVLVNNEIGNQSGGSGNQPGDYDNNHIGLDIQTMIVGSAGGALRTGNFLDYRTDLTRTRWSQYIGTAYNNLLITCMLAMGLSPDDWEVGGEPGYGDMRGSPYGKTDGGVISDLRAMLPRMQA